MTTVAQVKQAVQPLLQRNPDLALVGRLVVIKPVHHILRGISVGRSLDPLLFVPTWAVVFLFEPRESFSYNWGQRIYRPPPGPGVWDITDPRTPATMCEEIERIALPLLRPIRTIDDFVAFTSKERFRDTYLDLYEERRIFVDVARGDLDAARAICAYFATDRAMRRYGALMEEEYDRITKTLCPLIAANDRSGLVRLLRGWEAHSVKRLKLEKLWEPTPFPLELQMDQG
jgi:hypothetical protein